MGACTLNQGTLIGTAIVRVDPSVWCWKSIIYNAFKGSEALTTSLKILDNLIEIEPIP